MTLTQTFRLLKGILLLVYMIQLQKLTSADWSDFHILNCSVSDDWITINNCSMCQVGSFANETDGLEVKTLIIFKRKRDSKVKVNTGITSVQEKGWTDESGCLKWILNTFPKMEDDTR
ncbi:hypothetical protein ScPMuIL_000048 [Solemya velum]